MMKKNNTCPCCGEERTHFLGAYCYTCVSTMQAFRYYAHLLQNEKDPTFDSKFLISTDVELLRTLRQLGWKSEADVSPAQHEEKWAKRVALQRRLKAANREEEEEEAISILSVF